MTQAISPSKITTVDDSSKLELNEPLTEGQRGEFTEKTRALMERFDAINRVVEEYDEDDYVEGNGQPSIEQLVTMRARARRDEVKHLRKLRMVLAQLRKFYQWDNTFRRAEDVVFVQGLARQIDRPLVTWDRVGSKRAREGDDNSGGDSPPTKRLKSGDGATATNETSLVSSRETETSGPDDQPTGAAPGSTTSTTVTRSDDYDQQRAAEMLANPLTFDDFVYDISDVALATRPTHTFWMSGGLPAPPSPPAPITIPEGTKNPGMFGNVTHKRSNEAPDSPTDAPAVRGTKYTGMFAKVPHMGSNAAPDSQTEPIVRGTRTTGMFAEVAHRRTTVVLDSPTYVPASPTTFATPATPRTPSSPSSPLSPLSLAPPSSITPASSITLTEPRPFVLGYVSGSVFDDDPSPPSSPVRTTRRRARRRNCRK